MVAGRAPLDGEPPPVALVGRSGTPALPLHDTAVTIAGAVGLFGSNRDYLEQLAGQLDTLGIDDPYVRRLLRRVRALAGPSIAGSAAG